jgi:predicted lipid carrier protein YhbT
VATVDEVETVLAELLARLGDVDESTRALLPARRTIEARCPDLELVRFAEWRHGRIAVLDELPGRRADIRISVRSDDLLALAAGELPFSRAYASNRVRLDASMGDLLRLRAAL